MDSAGFLLAGCVLMVKGEARVPRELALRVVVEAVAVVGETKNPEVVVQIAIANTKQPMLGQTLKMAVGTNIRGSITFAMGW